MKTAIVSDIHGNLEALQRVLEDIESQNVDRTFCLGDVIGYGPNPRECVDIVRGFDLCILGNHDQAALFDPEGFSHGAEQAIFWTRRQLESGEDKEAALARWHYLCGLPRTHREGERMFVHGSARNPLCEYVFPEDIYNPRKLEKIFSLISGVCFQGHTHVPGIFFEDCRFLSPTDLEDGKYTINDEKIMVNVGSVGQPRDGDSRSCYVILDDDIIQYRRVSYPIEATLTKIRETEDLDNSQGERLLEGH